MSNAFSVDLAGLDGLTQTLETMDGDMQGKLLNSLEFEYLQFGHLVRIKFFRLICVPL